MELLVALTVAVALVLVPVKILLSGFQREDARRAALFAAVDAVITEWESQNGEPVVAMDANLLLNDHLPHDASPKVLELAHQEYQRLLTEEPGYVAAQAQVQLEIRKYARMINGE